MCWFFFRHHFQKCLVSSSAEPIVRNGRPPSAHSVHSFLHQYTGSFKKPPLRRPQSVIGGGLGSLMVMPRNGSRLGETHTLITSTHTHGPWSHLIFVFPVTLNRGLGEEITFVSVRGIGSEVATVARFYPRFLFQFRCEAARFSCWISSKLHFLVLHISTQSAEPTHTHRVTYYVWKHVLWNPLPFHCYIQSHNEPFVNKWDEK